MEDTGEQLEDALRCVRQAQKATDEIVSLFGFQHRQLCEARVHLAKAESLLKSLCHIRAKVPA